jgi:phosphoglycerate dehydrogenase-like enzyme
LRTMKPTAYLINTARGPVVDEGAMCRAIRENWIAGAALDVFNQEPLPAGSPFLSLDPNRVLLTPHTMSNTDEARKVNRRMVVQTVLTALEGGVPETAVNSQVTASWPRRE